MDNINKNLPNNEIEKLKEQLKNKDKLIGRLKSDSPHLTDEFAATINKNNNDFDPLVDELKNKDDTINELEESNKKLADLNDELKDEVNDLSKKISTLSTKYIDQDYINKMRSLSPTKYDPNFELVNALEE